MVSSTTYGGLLLQRTTLIYINMKISLLILSIIAFVMGFGIFSQARSAVHEIEAFVLFAVSAILFSGYAIVSAINLLSNKIEKSSSSK